MRILLTSLLAAALLMPSAQYCRAETPPPSFAIGIGLEVSSGTFGTGSTSTFATVPVVIDWFPGEKTDFELTVPLLYQRTMNTGHAAISSDTGMATGTAAKSVAKMSGSGGGGGMFAGEYGLGDITVTCGYTAVRESETTPQLRPTAYVKFPTADDSKGFGTGKFDYGVGLAASKWLGNWQPFIEGRYIVQGAAGDETGAKNFYTADAGVAYSWSGTLLTSAYSRFGSELFDGLSAPLEARVKTVWRFGERTYTDVYVLKGFSDGSPDYGGGASLFFEF